MATKAKPPSRAKLLAEAKVKVEKGWCIGPLASEKIVRPAVNREGHRIIDRDLVSAVRTGIGYVPSAAPPYCLTIRGVDCDGLDLLVMVEISEGDDLLVFLDFVIP